MDAVGKVAEQFGVYWPNLIAQVVLFAIVYWVLKRLAFKPVIAMLEERRRRIEERRVPSAPREAGVRGAVRPLPF